MRSEGEDPRYYVYMNRSAQSDRVRLYFEVYSVSDSGLESWYTMNSSGFSSEVELDDGWQKIRIGITTGIG